MTSISVCIGTYGDINRWGTLAVERAIPSATRQSLSPVSISWVHASDLATARNGAAIAATGEWLCFLDADDELDAMYVESMTQIAASCPGPALIQPATIGVNRFGVTDEQPIVIPPKKLTDGNFMVIGTLIQSDQFHRLGGFRDLPMYEDWDLWLSATRDGAEHRVCDNAIYRVHVSECSRNNGDPRDQLATYQQIRAYHIARGAR